MKRRYIKCMDLYLCAQVLEEFSMHRASLCSVLCPLDMQLMDEVHEYIALKGIRDWSIGLTHLKALCTLSFAFFLNFLFLQFSI